MAKRGQKRSRSGQVIPQANAAQTLRALHAKLIQLDIVLGAVIRLLGRDKVQSEVDAIAAEIARVDKAHEPFVDPHSRRKGFRRER